MIGLIAEDVAMRPVMTEPASLVSLASASSTLAQAELALDICGAGLLARGVFHLSDVAIDRAAGPMITELTDVEGLVLSRSDAKGRARSVVARVRSAERRNRGARGVWLGLAADARRTGVRPGLSAVSQTLGQDAG